MRSTSLPSSQRKKTSLVSALLTTAILLGLSFATALNRQYIYDSIQFWNYQPSSEVAAIGKRASLTDVGIFTFYTTHPEINDSKTFNGKCGRKEQGSAVIGCYTDNRIYVYNVTDRRLDGIKEVTAAHEMLHAAYQRLSDSEREKINQLIEAEYAKLSDDPALAERMAFYARTEPGERDNELHSIIGTEFESISPQLEAHYAKYFTKRSDVVTLYSSYNRYFEDLENQTKALGAELDALKEEIDAGKKLHAEQFDALNKDIIAFSAKVSSNSISPQAASAQRLVLIARIEVVDKLRDTVNADVEQYRILVDEYNNTTTQKQNLYKSIDSTLTPAPKV